MINTFTIQQAVSKVFGVDDVPEFKTYKPFKEARDWLTRQDIEFDYQKRTVQNGIVVFAIGAGQPQITIVENDDDKEKLKNVSILSSLAPKGKKSAPKKKDDDASEVTADEVESNEEEKPQPKTKPRKSRRSK